VAKVAVKAMREKSEKEKGRRKSAGKAAGSGPATRSACLLPCFDKKAYPAPVWRGEEANKAR